MTLAVLGHQGGGGGGVRGRGREPGAQHPGVAGASHLTQQPGVRGGPPGGLQGGGAGAPDSEGGQGPVHLQQPPHVGRGQERVRGHGGRGPGGRGAGRGG